MAGVAVGGRGVGVNVAEGISGVGVGVAGGGGSVGVVVGVGATTWKVAEAVRPEPLAEATILTMPRLSHLSSRGKVKLVVKRPLSSVTAPA
jgi:hypothetical protein